MRADQYKNDLRDIQKAVEPEKFLSLIADLMEANDRRYDDLVQRMLRKAYP